MIPALALVGFVAVGGVILGAGVVAVRAIERHVSSLRPRAVKADCCPACGREQPRITAYPHRRIEA